jgi:hypothetical protein
MKMCRGMEIPVLTSSLGEWPVLQTCRLNPPSSPYLMDRWLRALQIRSGKRDSTYPCSSLYSTELSRLFYRKISTNTTPLATHNQLIILLHKNNYATRIAQPSLPSVPITCITEHTVIVPRTQLASSLNDFSNPCFYERVAYVDCDTGCSSQPLVWKIMFWSIVALVSCVKLLLIPS